MFPYQPQFLAPRRPDPRYRTPDDGLAPDDYYRYAASHPFLIRITGGQRIIGESDKMTTFYSWTLAYHPQDTADDSRPADVHPQVFGGAKNEDLDIGGWKALEASGSDTVPTDGSAVVLAWPSPSQDFLIFHWESKVFGEITGKKTSGSTTWYTWKEVEPAGTDASGHLFSDKPAAGLVGAINGGSRSNPLFDLNRRTDIPIGTIVQVFRYPVRADVENDAGYLQERPQAFVKQTIQADEEEEDHTQQDVTWQGGPALTGTYKLRITDANGDVELSDPISINSTDAEIDAAIVASTLFSDVTVVGDGESFTVSFDDDYEHVPLLEVVNVNVKADIPYFFSSGLPTEIPFYTGKITARRRRDDVWQYTFAEMEYDEEFAIPEVNATGLASNYNAIEVNNRRVPLNTLVRLRRVYGAEAEVSFTVTTAGNGDDVRTAFALYVAHATSGTYKLAIDGDYTDPIAWNADATALKAALEDLDGVDLSTFSGSGTESDPWTFDFDGDFDNHSCGSDIFASLGVKSLFGTSTYEFEYDGEKFFPAKVTDSDDVDGVWSFSWEEMASAGPNAAMVVKSGGRSGTKSTQSAANEINNRPVADNTLVWMTEADDAGDGDDCVTITRTQNGNGSVPTIWEVIINATEGTYTLAMDGGTETSELAYNSDAVDSALEAASGETVTVTGGGLPGDPFVITVTSDNSSHTLAVETNNLCGAAYKFESVGGYTGSYTVYENEGDESGFVFNYYSAQYTFENGLLISREIVWP